MPYSAPLLAPSFLPDHDQPYRLPAFRSVADYLSTYHGDEAVYVLYPKRIEASARQFLSGFPGKTLYAVKANPHPAVLRCLQTGGIRAFDVASIREIDLVMDICPEAELYLMHPVKSRQTIRHAYARGVRHYAFDCEAELRKILEETGAANDLHLHLRLALPKSGSANMPLMGKYGADFQTAISLLQTARRQAAKLGICFHVGSQCMDPADFAGALSYVNKLLKTSQISIDSLDCGGGFPVAYPGMIPPPLEVFFECISETLAELDFGAPEILCEPGRALAAPGGATLARVELRKTDALYLNEGAYGSLFDAAQCGWSYPVKLHKADTGQPACDALTAYRFFGPTCDSLDQMPGPFLLPDNVKEGDWIEIGQLGAYGQALCSDFNGFQSDRTIAVLG